MLSDAVFLFLLVHILWFRDGEGRILNERRRYLREHAVDGIGIRIGGDPEAYNFDYSTLTDATILIDRKCGQRKHNCPKFCDTAKFAQLYCTPECQNQEERRAFAVCFIAPAKLYDTPTSGERVWIRRDGFDIYGITDSQSAMFAAERTPISNPLRSESFRFLSAIRLNQRYSPKLASEFADWFARPPTALKQRNEIGEAVLSFTGGDSYRNNRDVQCVGALDRWNCIDWVGYPAFGKNMAMHYEAMFYNGELIHRNGKILFNIAEELHMIPTAVSDELVRRGHFLTPFPQWNFRIDSNADITITFTFSNSPPLVLTNKTLLMADAGAPFRFTTLFESPPIQYSEDGVWVMGRSLMDTRCMGYDYAGERIWIGDFRKHAFQKRTWHGLVVTRYQPV